MSDDLSRDVPPSSCLGCGKPNDVATPTKGDATLEPGAISVCFYCGHIAAFDESMRLRDLTSDEMKMVAGDRHLLAIQKARSMMRGSSAAYAAVSRRAVTPEERAQVDRLFDAAAKTGKKG